MNPSSIVPAETAGSSSGGDATSFKDALSDDASVETIPVAVRSDLPGPAALQFRTATAASETPSTFLDDSFLVVDDVSTDTTSTGEEVAVISGEAFQDADDATAAAAKKGGAVILPVSSSGLDSRFISGAVFAATLLDQRSGALPNPFSLWTLPDRYSPPEAETDEMQDTPAVGDGLSVGREMSRLESAISLMSLRLGQMQRAVRTLVDNVAGGGR